VVELNNRGDGSAEHSVASSSIIIPPVPSESSGIQAKVELSSPVSLSMVTASSKLPSDDDTDTDSVSLISVPSSDEDDDSAWEDSRSALTPAEPARPSTEYVVLYDDSSSSEEE
jgi:hypothetical protein